MLLFGYFVFVNINNNVIKLYMVVLFVCNNLE